MQYWGGLSFSVLDFNEDSGDTIALNLNIRDKDDFDKPKTALTEHFNNEFKIHIKGTHPYYDLSKDIETRIKDFRNANKDIELYEEYKQFRLSEQERAEKLYGKYHASIICSVEIAGRTNPIFYIVDTSFYDDSGNRSFSQLKERYVNYTTPQKIDEKIKEAITLTIKRLSKRLAIIRNCDSAKQ